MVTAQPLQRPRQSIHPITSTNQSRNAKQHHAKLGRQESTRGAAATASTSTGTTARQSLRFSPDPPSEARQFIIHPSSILDRCICWHWWLYTPLLHLHLAWFRPSAVPTLHTRKNGGTKSTCSTTSKSFEPKAKVRRTRRGRCTPRSPSTPHLMHLHPVLLLLDAGKPTSRVNNSDTLMRIPR